MRQKLLVAPRNGHSCLMTTLSGDVSHPQSADGSTKVPEHVWAYAQDHALVASAARDARRYLEELAEGGSIPLHAIESRAKSLASYQEKSMMKRADGTPRFSHPATEIHDCVAARVIVFTTRARNDLAGLIELHTEVIERKNPGDKKHNGYDSEHLVITKLKNADEGSRYVALTKYLDKYPGLEIQLRSVAGHAWAEYEHDIRYKSAAYHELSADGRGQIDQWFIEAGGMRRVMDDLFGSIEERLVTTDQAQDLDDSDELVAVVEDERVVEDLDPRQLTEETLSELVASRFPGIDRGDHSAVRQLLEHIQALNIRSVGALEVALENVEQGQVARLMDYPGDTSGVRRLDDELLATFTEQYVEVEKAEDRKQFLRLRLRRVRGKFAIYAIEGATTPRRLMTAASAVRELTRIVADEYGLVAATVNDATTPDRSDLLPSSKPRTVKTNHGPMHVATNFTRAWAEEVMQTLVSRTPDSGIRVFRAGDVLFESPLAQA